MDIKKIKKELQLLIIYSGESQDVNIPAEFYDGEKSKKKNLSVILDQHRILISADYSKHIFDVYKKIAEYITKNSPQVTFKRYGFAVSGVVELISDNNLININNLLNLRPEITSELINSDKSPLLDFETNVSMELPEGVLSLSINSDSDKHNHMDLFASLTDEFNSFSIDSLNTKFEKVSEMYGKLLNTKGGSPDE